MDYDSVLNGSALAAQCRELVDCLKQENSFYEYELTAITAYIESESLGEAADRLRDKSAELIQTIKTMITANEYDIHDLNLLSDFVDGINIDGYEVLTRMKEAIRNADDCNEQAEAYYHMALSCPIGSISDYYYDLSKSYHSYADSWERIADTLHKIELQYDEINYESSCLFIKGNSIRNVINLASPTTSNTYTLLKQPINTSSITKANSRTDEIYKFVYDYLTNRGFSEEQINYLYKNKYSLFSSLYVTAYRSTADCPTVIQNMKEALKEDFYQLATENEILEKNILDAIGWNYSNSEIRELDNLLQEFGIVNKYSIVCFLLCCNYESSRDQQYLGRDGYYYDSHNILYSEIKPKAEYGEAGRGIGYIQVTYVNKHKEVYDYLVQQGYIFDDNPVESIKDGYVSALAQNPWAVSAWYWTYEKKVGNLSLNDYVTSVIESDDYNEFSLGLPFVCEAFVNGRAPGGEVDSIHHVIARGTDKSWTVEDNAGGDNNWLWFNGVNSGYSSISRFEDFKDSYTKIKDFIE